MSAIGFYKDKRGRTRPVTAKHSSSMPVSGAERLSVVNALNEGNTITFTVEGKRLHGVPDVPVLPFDSLTQFSDWIKEIYFVKENDHIEGDFRSDAYMLNPSLAGPSIAGKTSIHFYGSMGSLDVRLE
mgnify:CR=1 FL=1